MARRIVCSSFDSHALRMAAKQVETRRVMPPAEKKWDWPAPHRSILDLKPLLLPERKEPISRANTEIPAHKFVAESDKAIRYSHRYAVHGTGDDAKQLFKAIHRNRKTITARRKELVQRLRHEARAMEQEIFASLSDFERNFILD